MGWAWKFAESVFLERNWEKDAETIGRQIRELVNYPQPMWVSSDYSVWGWGTSLLGPLFETFIFLPLPPFDNETSGATRNLNQTVAKPYAAYFSAVTAA